MSRTLLALDALLFSSMLAFAAPPPDANPNLSRWFESLTQPASGLPCCSISDCRIAPARATPEGYDALIEGEWLSIPRRTIVQRTDNPTGRAVGCYRRYSIDNGELLPPSIFCFVPPMEVVDRRKMPMPDQGR